MSTFDDIGFKIPDMSKDTNMIHFGDNLEIMRNEFKDGRAKLMYADPPFGTQKQKYERIWGDENEIRSFGDYLEGGVLTYIESFMRPRMQECYRILSDDGSCFLHCDSHAVAHLILMMDEIFVNHKQGVRQSIITWKRCNPKGNAKGLANNSDFILYYTKSKNFTFNKQYGPYSEDSKKQIDSESYTKPVDAQGGNGPVYDLGLISGKGYGFYEEKTPPNGYRWTKETMLKIMNEDRPDINESRLKPGWIKVGSLQIKKGRVPRETPANLPGVQFDSIWDNSAIEKEKPYLSDTWTDIKNEKKPEYPTQKPIELIKLIIKMCSNEGDVVFDPFMGGGTTAFAAAQLKRNYLGIESSDTACRKMQKAGLPVSWHENFGDYRNMLPHEFQNWACQKMRARNTSMNIHGPSGPDGKIDGVVIHDIDYLEFSGSPIQIKQQTGVNDNEVVKMHDICRVNNKKYGFIVALDFVKSSYEKKSEFINLGDCIITLVKAEYLSQIKYYDYNENVVIPPVGFDI